MTDYRPKWQIRLEYLSMLPWFFIGAIGFYIWKGLDELKRYKRRK